jgi:hypothetical protein
LKVREMNDTPSTSKPQRARAQAWHLCFERLQARPEWLESWLLGWALLLAWGAFAFLVFPPVAAVPAQAVFFAGLFPWILLPLVAAAAQGRCEAR